MNITVVGLGYVGLVTGACLASWGHQVRGVETNVQRLKTLRAGRAPFHEPGLDELVAEGAASGRLVWESSVGNGVADAEIVFVAVGTHDGNGGWQTDTLQACFAEVVPTMSPGAVLVVRSTLPPAFVGRLAALVDRLREEVGQPPIPVLLNPEFTREGSALNDFMRPERVVIGRVRDEGGSGTEILKRIFQAAEAPVLVMPAIDAALSKLGANLFLATKISFANQLASICDGFGATIDNVVAAMAYDSRIGGSFLGAGVGFGGSCLPNQVSMMARAASEVGADAELLRAVDRINHRQREQFVQRIISALGGDVRNQRIALLGLAFKPNTDDLRDAPSMTIARMLLEAGAVVVATDPMPRARMQAQALLQKLRIADSSTEAMENADAVAIVTEWPEYRALEWDAVKARMKGSLVADGRNCLTREDVTRAGLRYLGIGRGGDTLQPIPIRPHAGAEVTRSPASTRTAVEIAQ